MLGALVAKEPRKSSLRAASKDSRKSSLSAPALAEKDPRRSSLISCFLDENDPRRSSCGALEKDSRGSSLIPVNDILQGRV